MDANHVSTIRDLAGDWKVMRVGSRAQSAAILRWRTVPCSLLVAQLTTAFRDVRLLVVASSAGRQWPVSPTRTIHATIQQPSF